MARLFMLQSLVEAGELVVEQRPPLVELLLAHAVPKRPQRQAGAAAGAGAPQTLAGRLFFPAWHHPTLFVEGRQEMREPSTTALHFFRTRASLAAFPHQVGRGPAWAALGVGRVHPVGEG